MLRSLVPPVALTVTGPWFESPSSGMVVWWSSRGVESLVFVVVSVVVGVAVVVLPLG